jgi:hypothetical protein
MPVESVASPPEARSAPRPDLVRLPGSTWSLWSSVCVRGAGFPAATIARCSSPELARLTADAIVSQARRHARPADRHDAIAPSSREALAAAFAAEARRVRGVLREIARDPMFREAVLWQNPLAFKHAVGALAAAPAGHVNAAMRKKELLVASYLQRYTVKNDTIGFFGPVGWARFSDARRAIAATCGSALVSTRQLYFESWSIDAIAHALDADPDLAPWRVPRVAPFVRLDGSSLMIGARAVCDLSPDEQRLLAACDGRRHARAIAREMRSACARTFPAEPSVYDMLAAWQRAGYVSWSFEGPLELCPERTLRLRLDAIDDPILRARAAEPLDDLEAAARAVGNAAGNVDALEAAIAALESTFTERTGAAPTRAGGQVYAARTLVREECVRDATIELGADVVDRLGPPLALVLESVRWAVHALYERHDAEFRQVFDRLAGADKRPVALGAFFPRTSLARTPPGALSAIAVDVRAALEQRWASLLAIPAGASRAHVRSRDLWANALAAFAVPCSPASAWARYASPDLLIDATSVDAIARGDYQVVVGEIHLYNTLLQSLFIDHHPCRHELVASLDRDFPAPRVVWVGAKDTTAHRVQLTLRPQDVAYTAARDASPAPPARTLRLGDLVVADEDGALVVRTRDGRWRFTCAEFFGSAMMRAASGLFHLLPRAAHQPRVTVDHLVVAREQWHLPVSEIAFAARTDDFERYVECRRWARDRGFPPFVFVKSPIERKPTYIDLSSPLYVDLLGKFVRTLQRSDPSATLTIAEMLPGPDAAWLPDARGDRYASELRLVAVDLS